MSPLQSIVRSVVPKAGRKGAMMAMFSAYFDESCRDRTVVVAGLISSVDRWDGFARDWSKLLDKYKLSALHMNEFAHSMGEFKSWKGDDAKRKVFLQRVVEIIGKRCMHGVGIVINKDAFSATMGSDRSLISLYPNEYTTASLMSILLVSKWADRCHFDKQINYVFDLGNSERTSFEKAYGLARTIPGEKHFGALSFADDVQISQLQAADFVAYETCKRCADLGSNKRRFRASLKNFMNKVSYDCKVPEEDGLRRVLDGCKRPPRMP